jgi:hypothetical protein
MSMLFRHYFGHGLYLLHRKTDMHFSHTRNLPLTNFFLLLWITYRHWLTVCSVGRPTKKLLEHCSIHYTLNIEHTEYMTAAILSNFCGCRKKFGHVRRHCTPEVSISALGQFLYGSSDFVFILHWTHTETNLCRYFLNSHSHTSRCGLSWSL